MQARSAQERGSSFVAVWRCAVSLAAAGIAVGAALLVARGLGPWFGLGPLSLHMGQHILLMNAVAPLAAYAWLRGARVDRALPISPVAALVLATIAQVVLLWGWHIPPVFARAWQQPGLLLAMHATLFAAAVLFWVAVFQVRGHARWQPIFALLVTGKLFCLLGALLIFAPRSLYALSQSVHTTLAATAMSGLEDQQLAGLLMIVACPLTYVIAGVIIAARWILELDDTESSRAALASVRT